MNQSNWKIGKPKKSWACAEVEQVLWDFPAYKLDVDFQQLDSNCVAQLSDMPHGSELSDSTAKFGMKRAENDSIEYYHCQRVEGVFKLLRPELQELCEKYYFCKQKPSEIADEMNISYATLWRYKNDLVYHFKKSWRC